MWLEDSRDRLERDSQDFREHLARLFPPAIQLPAIPKELRELFSDALMGFGFALTKRIIDKTLADGYLKLGQMPPEDGDRPSGVLPRNQDD